MTTVPEVRIRTANGRPPNPEGSLVLYWMTAYRRLGWNFALQHAADTARRVGKPLVILEVLMVDYPFASHRLHRFILQGMAERACRLEGTGVRHYPFVARHPGEERGLVRALGSLAYSVVTDDWPSFIQPGMARDAGRTLPVRLELVDSNGLLPLRATERIFTAAYHFRRFLQRVLPDHLPEAPDPHPLSAPMPAGDGVIPAEVLERWPPATGALLEGDSSALQELALDDSVPPVTYGGGTAQARQTLSRFLERGLRRYHEDRNHPDKEATSGLSPYLHFGVASAHEVFAEVAAWEGWTPLRLAHGSDGSREGWWGMSRGAEAFLDQLVTWRELGFNTSLHCPDATRYESLPEWSRRTLEKHEADPRPQLYSLEELRGARTHDAIWNAAQRQLLEEGTIHNYLRMLWGKTLVQWTPTPRDALEVMIELNDGLALDGRDPNSYSGIFWCLGRYDRGWPERPIFGKVRSMTSGSTRRKIKMKQYLHRFSSENR